MVLVHGWGMNRRIFNSLRNKLSNNYQVIMVDLPGHGDNQHNRTLTLDAVAEQLLDQIDGRCHWLGWSLGGAIVMHVAQRAPERFRSLMFIAANPYFVKALNWTHGIDPDVLNDFEQKLAQYPEKTLKRFIALQVLHSDDSHTTSQQLKEVLCASNSPDRQSLLQGLAILQKQDQRKALASLHLPMQVILGASDALIPVSVKSYYEQLASQPEIHVIAGAGHVPFLSHQQQVYKLIAAFLHQYSEKVEAHG